MQHRPAVSSDSKETRADLWGTFSQVYLHRNMECMSCHNSDYSTTGVQTGWPRHYPLEGSFERALFQASSGVDPLYIHGPV